MKSVALFRITRNGDFDLVEHEDSETDFIDEIKKENQRPSFGKSNPNRNGRWLLGMDVTDDVEALEA